VAPKPNYLITDPLAIIRDMKTIKRHALRGLVKGRVQGVFFRAETQRQAQELGLAGWVRNTAGGHVELLIAGEEAALERMREWLRQGPVLAKVDSVELRQDEDPGLPGFQIRQS